MAIKNFKIPEVWGAETSKILENLLQEIYADAQSKYIAKVTVTPKPSDGMNGEMRLDVVNNKLYIKVEGAWKSASLT